MSKTKIITIDNFNHDEPFMIDWCSDYNDKKEYLNIQMALSHSGIKLNDFSIDFAIDLIDKDGDAENLFSDSESEHWEYIIEKLNSNLSGLINKIYFPNNISIEMTLKSFLNKIDM